MTWVRLDDQFFDHPKAIKAGRDGRDFFIAALCYCAGQLTNGFIATEIVPLIGFKAGVPNAKKAAMAAATAGLLEIEDGGYRIHDFLDYNPSADKVRGERDAAKERMARNRGGKHAPNFANDSAELQDSSQNVRANKDRSSGEVRITPSPTTTPSPSPNIDIPETTDRPGGAGGESSGPSSKNGHRPENPTVLAFIAKTLADHPGWDAVLTIEERSQSVRRLVPWQRSVLQAWLDGDGAPTEERIAECQRILAQEAKPGFAERGDVAPPTPAKPEPPTSPYPPARKLDYPVITPEKAAENSRRLRENSARLAAKMTGKGGAA